MNFTPCLHLLPQPLELGAYSKITDVGGSTIYDFNCFGSIRILQARNRLPEPPIATRKAMSGHKRPQRAV